MKHWIAVGCCVIVGTVMLFRSRTAPRQTLPAPTTGIATTRPIAP